MRARCTWNLCADRVNNHVRGFFIWGSDHLLWQVCMRKRECARNYGLRISLWRPSLRLPATLPTTDPYGSRPLLLIIIIAFKRVLPM